MGADIHIVIEALPRGRTEWVGVGTTQFSLNFIDHYTSDVDKWPTITRLSNRNYTFFAALAGVRGEGPAPLGLPKDASSMTKWLLRQDDYFHSHSHCSLQEFIAKRSGSNGTGAAVAAALTGEHELEQASKFFNMKLHQMGVDKFRVCFAFDN